MRPSAALFLLGALLAAGDASDCVAMSGNGSLTIGFDSNGALSVCRWPGTTAPNQVTYSSANPANRGGMWGIPRDGGIDWLPETYVDDAKVAVEESPIITVAYRAIGAVGTVFVCKDIDVAVFRLQFNEMPASNTAIWYSDFSPCTSVMRALPSSELLFPARRDMVAFTEYDTIYHARPNAPDIAIWDDAEEWVTGGKSPQWFEKGTGAWIAYAADKAFAGVACGPEHGDGSAIALAETGEWNAYPKALGGCASAAVVPIDPQTRSATVYVALGETRAEADAALSTARQHGFQALFDAARAEWKERAQIGMLPVGVGDDVMGLRERATVTLLTMADAQSGAIARGPHSEPASCVVMPRDVAWVTRALDLASQTQTATNYLQFYARNVRTSDSSGAPAGSLPAMMYGAGQEASPQILLDVEAPAWLLWSIWQHDAQVPEGDRDSYRKEMWKCVELTGDFLSNWSRAVRDTPAFSYDFARRSDTHSLETIAVVYAGLRAADAFARVTGNERQDWAQRLIELEDYLRFNALDFTGEFKTADPLSLWMTDIAGAGDPRWNAAVQHVLDEVGTSLGPEALKKLAMLAMLLRDQKDKIATLRPVAVSAVHASMEAHPCDSHYAALAVIVLLLVYG